MAHAYHSSQSYGSANQPRDLVQIVSVHIVLPLLHRSTLNANPRLSRTHASILKLHSAAFSRTQNARGRLKKKDGLVRWLLCCRFAQRATVVLVDNGLTGRLGRSKPCPLPGQAAILDGQRCMGLCQVRLSVTLLLPLRLPLTPSPARRAMRLRAMLLLRGTLVSASCLFPEGTGTWMIKINSFECTPVNSTDRKSIPRLSLASSISLST